MRERRKNAIWIAIAMGAIVTIIAFSRDHTDDNLVGVWKLESTQQNGQPQRQERELWVFRHGTLTIVRDDDIHNARISVDPSASPRHLDTDILFQTTGIYEIDGDTLRVSQVVLNMPRPTEFKTTWGDMRTVSVLRRVHGDRRLSTDELRALLVSEFGPATDYPKRMEFDKDAEAFISGLMRDVLSEETTTKEGVVYHVSRLITEVDNGGFHQFFYNSSGNNAVETVAMLRTIGAPETAELVEAGCKLFPGGFPAKDHRKRRAQLEQFSLDELEALRDLQERFYSRREDLYLLLKKYWESEP